MKLSRNKGFTLIELLVVVLIVGILASIAIPQYFKVVEKARVGEAMSLITAVKSAEERYLANGGVYASDFSNLDISYPNLSTSAITLKYFSASIAVASGSAPNYQLTVTRQTASSSVAPRYGVYSVYVNVPSQPVPIVSACVSSGNCDELIK